MKMADKTEFKGFSIAARKELKKRGVEGLVNHLENAYKIIAERDKTIENLQKGIDDLQNKKPLY